jgi:hypothetical protein
MSMMADRKRLAALVLAQIAAFAAVLILAAFTGPSSPPPSRGVTFTVSAAPSSIKFKNPMVVTYDAGTLKQVDSHRLGSNNSAPETVQAGDHGYLVCISPPQGWKSTSDTFLLGELICKYLPPTATDKTVSFTFGPVS